MTLGFSEAEDKAQHAAELSGVASLQRGGGMMGEGMAEGDSDLFWRGVSEAAGGTSQFVSWVAGAYEGTALIRGRVRAPRLLEASDGPGVSGSASVDIVAEVDATGGMIEKPLNPSPRSDIGPPISQDIGGPSAVLRVAEEGKPAFQLRSGEKGLSVFDADMVGPEDVLPSFREGSTTVRRTAEEIEAAGCCAIRTQGDANLPQILQDAHMEIRPGPGLGEGMSEKAARKRFKKALKELEQP
jgi:hypothetical protein